MKDSELIAAYDRIAPDPACKQRMLQIILNSRELEVPTAGHRRLRRVLLAAACIAAVAALAVGGYAAYEKWTLPEPAVYEVPSNGGFYEIHETAVYTDPALLETEAAPAQTEDTTASPGTAAPLPADLTDEDFIRQGLALLRQVGILEVTPEQLTLVRQENLYWGREEAEILFDQGAVRTSVKFNAKTGKFLGLFGIDWQIEGSTACSTHAEADALARRYYESLPVEQGYQMTGCEQYDEQYWSYDFCREVEPGVFNQFEMVRISINPVSGRLTGCVVFYVPLLDDHEPGQERITQEQAELAAAACAYVDLEGYSLLSADVVIGLPNWIYTPYQDAVNRRASDVTRWAWSLTYTRPNSEFPDQIRILVDCYTGEILGGDATK